MKKNKNYFIFPGLMLFSLLAFPRFSNAADIWVYVEKFAGLSSGNTLPIKVGKGELFLESLTRAVTKKLELEVHEPGGKKYLLPLTPEELFWSGEFTAHESGAHLIVARIDEDYWTRTGTKWVNLPKNRVSFSKSSIALWYLSKAILATEGDDRIYRKILGDPLEIIPLDNPALIKAGGEIRVKVLFQGKPLSSTPVEATYDGFDKNPEVKAASVRTDKNGIAKIPIQQAGLWYITTIKFLRGRGNKLYKNASYQSNLIFQIHPEPKTVQ